MKSYSFGQVLVNGIFFMYHIKLKKIFFLRAGTWFWSMCQEGSCLITWSKKVASPPRRHAGSSDKSSPPWTSVTVTTYGNIYNIGKQLQCMITLPIYGNTHNI